MKTTFLLEQEILDEVVVPGRRLGRHVNHDSRSKAYRVEHATQTTTNRKRLIPILDQGSLGSCTGNAETGALGSEGIYETISGIVPLNTLNEDFAVALYGEATALDTYTGTYPPDDSGSDGLSVNKAAQKRGLIAGYVHALSVDDMINGLQKNAGVIGINWYSSFDDVDGTGVLQLTANAKNRGGHELHLLNVDMDLERFEVPNSWGPSWGQGGVCFIPFTVMERLLKEDGDATFPVPITKPAPTPDPTVLDATGELIKAMDVWEKTVFSRITKAGKAKIAYDNWKRSR